MKKIFFTTLFFLSFIFVFAHTNSIVIDNKSKNTLVDYTVEIPLSELNLPAGNYIVTYNNNVYPVEIIYNLNNTPKAIFPVHEIKAGETQKYYIKQGTANQYPKRTYAELAHKIGGKFEPNEPKKRIEYIGGYSWVKPNNLRVPDNFTDHAYYIKYEGPGWESDKVAFRFYLDWRNGIDVFGKKTPQIVLPFVGVDGYDNYHNMADWGMDNMKVGKSLGIGSIAMWDGEKAERVEKRDSVFCYITADGKIRSQVATDYYGWTVKDTKCNLKSLISIDAGSRASHMELLTDKSVKNLATGIIKSKNAEFFKSDNSKEWSYIATFGKQSLNNDMQGLVIFYKTAQLAELTEDALNHVVVLKPDNGYVEYYFMPTWELDWQAVPDKAKFQECINEVLARLNNKPIITIN